MGVDLRDPFFLFLALYLCSPPFGQEFIFSHFSNLLLLLWEVSLSFFASPFCTERLGFLLGLSLLSLLGQVLDPLSKSGSPQ